MTPYILVALALGWCAGMATAMFIGARLQATKRPRIIMHDDANPLRDPEIIDALERQIAKWKAAAHE